MEASAQKEFQDITIDETQEEVQVPENDGNKEISINYVITGNYGTKSILLSITFLHIMLLLK